MKSKKNKKQIVSLLLCAVMLFGFIPQGIAVASAASDDGLCEHHTEHTADCGYSEGAEGSPCTHEHTEDCYTTITRCAHIHTEDCYAKEDTEKETPICNHVCSENEGCTTERVLSCKHEHNENCGYVEAVEGTPCTYVCEICNAKDSGDEETTLTAAKVLELINKLPTVEELKAMSEDEQREVYNGSYMEVLDAYELLPEEEQTQIDESEKLMALAAFFSSLLTPAEAGPLNVVYLNGEAGDDSNTGAADSPVKTFAKAKELLAKDGTIYISKTVTVSGSESWTLEPDTYGTASVKRATSFNEVMVLVEGTGGALTLENITLDGGSRSLGSTSTVASIVKMEGGSLTLKSGAVLQNNYNARSGGGIHASNSANIEMRDDAVIQNCGTWTNLFAGGGVALYNSTMDMKGGMITNCRANKGGGVAVIASTFNMSGGEISECTLYDYGTKNTTGLPSLSTESTNAYGCGIVVSNGLAGGTASKYSSFNGTFAYYTGVENFQEGPSTFNLTGGTIKNNGVTDFTKTSSNVGAVPMGGGICAIPHDFTNYFDADYSSNTENLEINISGGTISGNGAAYGGGICLMFSPSKLTMTGGTIDDNQAYKDGGGIYIATRNTYAKSRPNNTISGGTISNNHAGGLFSMNGSSLGKWSLGSYGGGICLDGWTNGSGFQGGATLEVSGTAKIEKNTAQYGGGIAAQLNATATIQGGEIINNSAEWWNAEELGQGDHWMNGGYGGGIYSANALYIYGGTISNNTSDTTFVKMNNTKHATYGNGVFCTGYVYMHGSPTFGKNDDVAFQGGSSNYYIWIDRGYTPGDTPVSVSSAYYYTSGDGYWYSARGVEIISDAYTSGYQTGTILVGYSDAAGGQEAAAAAAAAGNFVPSKAMQDASDQSTYTSRTENSEPITIGHSKLWNSSGKYIFLTYKQSVTVTYKANTDLGGSGEDVVKTYEKGSTPAALSNTETKFSNTGHNFTGWNTLPQPTAANEGKSYTEGVNLESLTSDLVLYAQWEKAETKYTLTYVTNGGSDVADKNGAAVADSSGNKNKETYAENDIAKLFERITEKTDYEFTGWYSDETLNNYIPEQELEIEADTTVYAGWGFKFTFNPNGGTMEKPSGNNVTDNGDGTYSVLVTAGKLVAEPTDPTRSGSYTFLGWNTEKDGSGKMWDFDTDTATGPTTLYAQWKYTGGGSGGGGGDSDTYITVTAKKEWKLDDGGEKTASVTVVLYRNGAKYAAAELNESNNWTHTWNNLNEKYTWTVEEETVPEGFASSVERSGNTFTITNDDKPENKTNPDTGGTTEPDDPDTPDTPDNPSEPTQPDNPSKPDKPIDNVPQTGDNSIMGLWITLACFSLFGMLLAVFGRKRIYKRCR